LENYSAELLTGHVVSDLQASSIAAEDLHAKSEHHSIAVVVMALYLRKKLERYLVAVEAAMVLAFEVAGYLGKMLGMYVVAVVALVLAEEVVGSLRKKLGMYFVEIVVVVLAVEVAVVL
jgi:hypothetical protein